MTTTDTPDIAIIETSSLGDRSYLISHHGIALVVDPQRDIEEQLAHRVEVGKECSEEPRHLGVVELTVAHLAILLEPVLREGRSPRS